MSVKPEPSVIIKLRLAGQQGMALAFVGLIIGGVSGWLGLFISDNVNGIARIEANVYLVLGVLFPFALWAMTLTALDEPTRPVYGTPVGAAGVLLGASLPGSILGTLLFMLAAINVPAIFGGQDSMQMWTALTAQIGWARSLGLIALTVLAGAVIAAWAYRQLKTLSEN